MRIALKKFFGSTLATILFHLLIWTSFFILQYTLGTPFRGGSKFHEDQPNAFPLTLLFLALSAAMYYINYYFLLPKVLINNKYINYIGAMIICAVIFGFAMRELTSSTFIQWRHHGPPPVFTFFPFVFIWAVSTALRLTNDRLLEEKEKKERETERLKSELNFLRSQISPHFMFNVLNTIVALSRKRPQKVEPVVIQLSELMRYMLYDSDETRVSVQKETEYLQNYIDLQKLRFGDIVTVNYQTDITGEGTIEPMLLIPFIENAFKHGVGRIKNPEINISFSLKAGVLTFDVSNKYNEKGESEVKDQSSGIGLKNVARRLSLLYALKHSLNINQENELFNVNLTIALNG